jgi:2-polyprenyl-6-methoxyphenol hydroxylase-like FAD-dependent oxidoreductase
VTLAEVTSSLARVTGRDLAPRDMFWQGRYRSGSRRLPTYRYGRVFFAGHAAHTHSPAGAQGMNTGLQDAFNLGWKLGAALAGWAPEWLPDSYHAERHRVGAAVLALTAPAVPAQHRPHPAPAGAAVGGAGETRAAVARWCGPG